MPGLYHLLVKLVPMSRGNPAGLRTTRVERLPQGADSLWPGCPFLLTPPLPAQLLLTWRITEAGEARALCLETRGKVGGILEGLPGLGDSKVAVVRGPWQVGLAVPMPLLSWG